MKEWQILLDHIDCYVYDHQEEKIVFSNCDNMVEAKNNYNHIVSAYGIDQDANDLWAFDIALDCVRKMSDEDKKEITKNTDVFFHHFGYALGVRNEYLHGAKKHFFLFADDQSCRVMEMIFAMLCPDYILE